jgi:phosphoserine phosphatase RsbU/P
LLLGAGLQIYFSHALWEQTFHPERVVRSPVEVEDTSPRIDKVTYGKEAGLAVGQRLIAVDGRPYRGQQDILRSLDHNVQGGQIALTVADAGGSGAAERTVRLKLEGPQYVSSWARLADNGVFFLLTWFSLALGAVVLILKPWDRLAWFLALLLLSFSYMFSNATFAGLPAVPRIAAIMFHDLIRFTWPVWLLLFGIYFPDRFALDLRAPWLKWLVVGPQAVAIALYRTLYEIAVSQSFALAATIAPLERLTSLLSFLLPTVAVTAFFTLVGFRRGTATNPDVRRKIRLLSFGASVSFAPMFFYMLAAVIVTRGFRPGTSFTPPTWMGIIVLAAFTAFPLTLGYLVLVHRALDVGVVIRQGLQYALARRGVVVLQVLVSTAAFLFALKASPANRAYALGAALAAVLGARNAAERLREWIDRRFFREAYQAEHVLSELSESVRTMVETQPLVETLARRVAETLHVARAAVLLPGDSDSRFRPAFALGYAQPPAVAMAPDAVTVGELRRATEPVRVYFDDPASWLNRFGGPGENERTQLLALDSQLLLPLSLKTRILGILSLGPKRSEEPYSKSDLRLLASVAGQAALALENSRLAASIARETASRERLNRELEIARDVQRRFFPQKRPAIVGIDYAGTCRPAQSVGGDYFDFRALSSGRLGLAIGDVAGKGAPAALLMASLQASLRAAVNGAGDLGALMANLNALIGEITPASRFATLFYAQYDPATRRLDYVNAGHNPPLVVRHGLVLPLERGGPAVGLSRTSRYTERRLDLQPGDLLAAYTDGVTEAMNAALEEFGEERFAEVLRGRGDAPAAAILDAVLQAVDTFAGGAPQHDDITLVILKVSAQC